MWPRAAPVNQSRTGMPKSKWFYKVNEDFGSFEFTPEIKAKVDMILQGAKDETDSHIAFDPLVRAMRSVIPVSRWVAAKDTRFIRVP